MKNEDKVIDEIKLGGIFTYTHIRDGKVIDEWEDRNLVNTVGLNHFLDTELNGGTAVSTWYIGLYSNTYTPQADDTASHIGTRFTEITAYDELARVAYVPNGNADSGLMSNSFSRAEFTFNASETVSGAMFLSVSTKNSTSGILLAASAHSPARNMISADVLLVQYNFQGSSS